MLFRILYLLGLVAFSSPALLRKATNASFFLLFFVKCTLSLYSQNVCDCNRTYFFYWKKI